MALERLRKASKKVAGQKQALRAIKNGEAKVVLIARDAERHVIEPVVKEGSERQVEVIEVDNMVSLGKACGIKVKAAVAAILEE
ncbi:MAG TPA: 50S ribosomal protein L7Ae-like protein [Firmicutes bacterium]|nr:50S ribosomal protein L7Ae-like protein [Bacillota bacterium]